MTHYFAYGSNLDQKQMRQRCPGSKLIGPARLPGYKIAFAGWSRGWGGGVATVVRRKGSVTPGLLYLVPKEDLAKLDRCEGHPRYYQRQVKKIRLGKKRGKAQNAEVYILNEIGTTPSLRYFGVIWRAYKEHGFPEKPLIAAASTSRNGNGSASQPINGDGIYYEERPMTKVFVYGTLRQGECNHRRYLGSAKCLGAARTEPAYSLVDLNHFPAMIDGGTSAVVGEVYEVTDEELAMLDRLEGHPNFYYRTTCRLETGQIVSTYMMLGAKVEGYPRIDSGDWLDIRQEFLPFATA
jgi:gamma-glutamylcyclotransferase (GGCT)/AIG2-like uncharacterized protein YtfP